MFNKPGIHTRKGGNAVIEIVIRDSRQNKGAAMQVHEDLIEDNPDKAIEALQNYVARIVGEMIEARNAANANEN